MGNTVHIARVAVSSLFVVAWVSCKGWNPPTPPADYVVELPDGYPTFEGLPVINRVDIAGGGELVHVYDEALDDSIVRWAECVSRVTACFETNAGRLGGCVDDIEICPDNTGGKHCCPPRCIEEYHAARDQLGEAEAINASFLRGHCVDGFAEQTAGLGLDDPSGVQP